MAGRNSENLSFGVTVRGATVSRWSLDGMRPSDFKPKPPPGRRYPHARLCDWPEADCRCVDRPPPPEGPPNEKVSNSGATRPKPPEPKDTRDGKVPPPRVSQKRWPRLPSDDDPTWIGIEEEIRKDAYYMMGEPDLAALWATEPAEALIRAGERRALGEKKERWVEALGDLVDQVEIFLGGRAKRRQAPGWRRWLANLFRKRS